MLGNRNVTDFIAASEKLDEITRDALQPLGDTPAAEDVKAALLAAAKSPEVQATLKNIRDTAPQITAEQIATRLTRSDLYNAKPRLEAACNTHRMSSEPYVDNCATSFDALQLLEKNADWARDTLKNEYGVREPANATDIKRAGAEAQQFAKTEYHAVGAAADIVAASMTKEDLHRQAHNFCKSALLETHNIPDAEQEKYHGIHAEQLSRGLKGYAVRHGKGFSRERLSKAIDVADFSSLAADRDTLASRYAEDRPHTGLFFDTDKEALRFTEKAQRNVDAQTPDRTQEATKARGFSR